METTGNLYFKTRSKDVSFWLKLIRSLTLLAYLNFNGFFKDFNGLEDPSNVLSLRGHLITSI